MHGILLNLSNRIWAIAVLVAAVAYIAAGTSLTTGLILVAAALVLARWIVGRLMLPLNTLRARMSEVSNETARQEVLIRAQNNLLTTIGMLRDALYAHGEPRVVDGDLFFGTKRMNGNFEEVDQVKSVAGGTATIFLGDTRIATNVMKPDGTRAVGTQLAAGAAYDSVLRNGKTFRGDAEILGTSYVTVYEPIVSGGKVIGIIYAGARKDECVLVTGDVKVSDAFAEMSKAVSLFETAAIAKGKAELEAANQRYVAEEARREHEIMRKAAASSQRAVVDALSVALAHLSSGDLMQRVDAAFPAEYAKLKQDFNAALDKLRDTMVSIGHGARSMHNNSGEVSQAADDLSRRTEHQAASLEETAAALDELTVKVRKTADGAELAREIVSDTRSKAERGGDVVRKAISAMTEISASAQQIGQIINVIDEIAFQTNLLALNAGVEAARAGDSGRGFAVVASEVRSLAQRSADAAQQIHKLIATSATHVGLGVTLVRETGEALDGIIGRVADMKAVVEDIAISARDQASGLREVNIAVTDMDKVTQQNAAMVEESTAASQTLTREAEELVRMVGQFRIEASDGSAGRGRAPRRAETRGRAA